MPEESTIPDLVERTRAIWVAVNRQDWDAVLSFFAPNAIWDMSKMGLGTFEGPTALRGFWEDWQSSYEEYVFSERNRQ
jgi:ketosteroid isomerase-like protein